MVLPAHLREATQATATLCHLLKNRSVPLGGAVPQRSRSTHQCAASTMRCEQAANDSQNMKRRGLHERVCRLNKTGNLHGERSEASHQLSTANS